MTQDTYNAVMNRILDVGVALAPLPLNLQAPAYAMLADYVAGTMDATTFKGRVSRLQTIGTFFGSTPGIPPNIMATAFTSVSNYVTNPDPNPLPVGQMVA